MLFSTSSTSSSSSSTGLCLWSPKRKKLNSILLKTEPEPEQLLWDVARQRQQQRKQQQGEEEEEERDMTMDSKMTLEGMI
jgi:hypothetical protein